MVPEYFTNGLKNNLSSNSYIKMNNLRQKKLKLEVMGSIFFLLEMEQNECLKTKTLVAIFLI